jgi:hypothetical protein
VINYQNSKDSSDLFLPCSIPEIGMSNNAYEKRATLYENFDIERIIRTTLLGIGVSLRVMDSVRTSTI